MEETSISLSPGVFYQRVPRDYAANLRFRRKILEACGRSASARRAAIAACRQDILFYTNTFVWTYDPRKIDEGHSPFIPFITWEFQDRALQAILECIQGGEDLVIEKSRDMGASWLSLLAMEWLWHFHGGMSFLMVSRKAELVDSNMPDSLFWKIDFIHDHLPAWLMPEHKRRIMHFANLDNTATIDGESTNEAAGVGGRRTAMFIDEFSRISWSEELLSGTADTTRCRIFNFTHWGIANPACKLSRREDIRKLRMHWSEHPEKRRGLYRWSERQARVEILDPWEGNARLAGKWYVFPLQWPFIRDGKLRSPWYDDECCRRGQNKRDIAENLDIDPQGSGSCFFDAWLIEKLKAEYAAEPFWEGDIDFDPATGKPSSLFKKADGPIKVWCPLKGNDRFPVSVYAAGCDISMGAGSTNSCMSVLDARTGEKVLEYVTPDKRPEDFAMRCYAILLWMQNELGYPLLAWESQGPGEFFGKRIMELGYQNVFFREGSVLNPFGRPTEIPGWFPSNQNREMLLHEYNVGLSTRAFVNRSLHALDECLHFHWGRGNVVEHDEAATCDDPSGAKSNHGDRVIADALAWKMVKQLNVGEKKRESEPDEKHIGTLAWRRALAGAERADDGWG